MISDTELLKKRFLELARKSFGSGIFTFTDFLGLAEQSAFAEIKKELRGVTYEAFGGAVGAERVMIRFGSEDEIGYSMPFPISVIKAEPVSQKYADKLTHRDFLGAILNLGIERDVLGDIVIIDNVGYIFAKEDIASYIADSLTKVKRTDMKVCVTDTLPEGQLYRTERKTVQVSGERLDAIIAKVFSLSRDDAQSLFKKRLVFADGRQIDSTSYTPKENEKISVRGHGRFIYVGEQSLSRKGKKNVAINLYV
jgi:RNA-binding protein YlmH